MSSNAGAPLYAKVEGVPDEIMDGSFAIGAQLPTEDELILRFEVSRITVRRAIQNLVGQKALARLAAVKERLSRVASLELTELTGFVEDMHALGRKPTARLIDKKIVIADKTVALQLALTRGERVMKILRVRVADGVGPYSR